MLVMAGGDLSWDDAAGRFDADRSDAALPVLTQPGVLAAQLYRHDSILISKVRSLHVTQGDSCLFGPHSFG